MVRAVHLYQTTAQPSGLYTPRNMYTPRTGRAPRPLALPWQGKAGAREGGSGRGARGQGRGGAFIHKSIKNYIDDEISEAFDKCTRTCFYDAIWVALDKCINNYIYDV